MTQETEISSLGGYLSSSRVIILDKCTKQQVLDALIESMGYSDVVGNVKELAEGIYHREELMSTGIGLGIGVPHVRLASVKSAVISAAVCSDGVENYESIDGKGVQIVFMIAANKEQHVLHIKLLSRISKKLKDGKLQKALINARDGQEFCRILNEGE
jgi:mannitol/fructose-specific phosphotransferase system IIA component (Ntr-type)